ncbi:MAG: type VI secretion system tip protein VgrG [Candidatus Zixiibacteriota bacterium]|nr:MAG: type VI secretion system tip protein VgrG [candidate division Zixibacteria bacterium]
MAFLTAKKFSFISAMLDSETFAVVNFHGFDALSKPYEFEVTLASQRGDLNLAQLLQQPARFIFHRESGGDVTYHGILAQFEQHQEFNQVYFYRAKLVPKLWWLQLTYHNQIFLDKSLPEILDLLLADAGLGSQDYGFKLQNDYPKIPYVCQYGESHLDFLCRWLEREGLYYYFEQNASGEKVVITDTRIAHTEACYGGTLKYHPVSGLDFDHRTEVIKSFTCQQKLVPARLYLKDYNYEKPTMMVTGSAEVDPGGRGQVYYYGERFDTPAEGERLAGIRAEEILCRKEVYLGESTVPYVEPGYCFNLEGHYRGSMNQQYLTLGTEFEGSQTGFLIAGLQAALAGLEKKVYYLNRFTAIPYSVQFRAERCTHKPRVHGVLPAKIDDATDGEYAQIDDQGRYKVIMPFDESGRCDGKASIWLRMAQPYAGNNYGMHFPLHKGTEVMVGFCDGDPDRPIIDAAVPNPETISPVTRPDHTINRLKSAAGNEIMMEDKTDYQRTAIHSPYDKSHIYMGSPSRFSLLDGIRQTTKGYFVLHAMKGIFINGWQWETPEFMENINRPRHCFTDNVRILRDQVFPIASALSQAAQSKVGQGLSSLSNVEQDTNGVIWSNLALGESYLAITKQDENKPSGIILSAPNSIINLTPETFSAIGMNGVALITPASADVMGNESASLMSSGEVDVFSKEKDVKVVAGQGNIVLNTKQKSIKLDADSDEITITAAKKITLKCGGSTVTLSPGQIVINAPLVKIN